MDVLLHETATKVASHFQLTSCLLDAIKIIPSTSNEVLINVLKSEMRNGKNQDIEDINRLQTQLITLWNIESSLKDTPWKERLYPLDLKTQESLFNAILTLALSINKSSIQIQQQLLKVKKTDREYDDIIEKIKKYIQKLNNDAYKEISTSVEHELEQRTTLFKLIEKCNVMEEDKLKLTASLNEKEVKLDHEKAVANKRYDGIRDELNTITIEMKREEERLENEISIFLENEEKIHDVEAKLLKSKLASIKLQLSQLQQSHFTHQTQLIEQYDVANEQLTVLTTQFQEEEQNIRTEMERVSEIIVQEQEEHEKLKQLISLYRLNESIMEKEQKMIQTVIELECEADKILFHAATQLQKLYRGIRDRSLVKLMKKKSKKGKKAKGTRAKKVAMKTRSIKNNIVT